MNPGYPVLLGYRDGSDLDLFIAGDSSDLREMESSDVKENAWDGWDSNGRHFVVVWSPRDGFVLKQAVCDTALDEVQAEYERIYLTVVKKGHLFRLSPAVTKAWIDGVTPYDLAD